MPIPSIRYAVILNENNNSRMCTTRHCFGFIFIKDNDNLVCKKCGTVNVVTPGDSEGPFPRKRLEFTDALILLPRYSFVRGESSVRRVLNPSGLYREEHAVAQLMEAAQEEINVLRAQLEGLMLKTE